MKLRNPALAGCFPAFFRNQKPFFSRHTNSQWIMLHPAMFHTVKNGVPKNHLHKQNTQQENNETRKKTDRITRSLLLGIWGDQSTPIISTNKKHTELKIGCKES